jgi:hypothetical protein
LGPIGAQRAAKQISTKAARPTLEENWKEGGNND